MSARSQSVFCLMQGWGLAAISGGVASFLFRQSWDWGVLAALLGGVVVFIILGCLMTWYVCQPKVAPTFVSLEQPRHVPALPEPVLDSPQDCPTEQSAEREAPKVRPTKPLAGEIELAARKGVWSYTASVSDNYDSSPKEEPSLATQADDASAPERLASAMGRELE
jgi:hypothetical protein